MRPGPTLIVMLKEPRPGRVKTRLAREIGSIQAKWWFRHQVADLLRRVDDPRWEVVLAVSPDREGLVSRVWPDHFPRIPQGGGDLGHRMSRAMMRFPRHQVCVIGGDIPEIRPRHISNAFALLGSHTAVFGPAIDGGYWLVGMQRGSRARPDMFKGVRWSSPNALSDSTSALPDHRIAFADTLRDVDTAKDLAATPAPRRF
ncbi:MAG: TIGR04282 family arsenosugar biosynthesis glycosyltransferase [Heliomarina sp.]|uniref:TIGR04282 family arsenosugar biosynthesis glycosyltransferase n=1 Tax=Heliomarina sp. TaxID=2917556 RepID=UPI0040591ED1